MMDGETPPSWLIPKGRYKVKVDSASFGSTTTRGTRYIKTKCHILGKPDKTAFAFNGDGFGGQPYVSEYNKRMWEFLEFPDTSSWKAPRDVPELVGRTYNARIDIIRHRERWYNSCRLLSRVK